MSIEVVLFVIVGALSVAAAVAMLLDENAVHSALFLILNFACVAFLYLMLDASFLAMVQIAVYAGAIMVLFLFVIMLLGAEKVGGGDVKQFKWAAPLALVLSLGFLITVSIALIAGKIDERETPETRPLVRVVHVAPGFNQPADIYLNDQLVAEGAVFRDASDYIEVEPGEYSVAIGIAGDAPENAFPIGSVTLEAGQTATVIAYGRVESPLPTMAVVQEDLSTVSGRKGRLVFFNAYPDVPAVDLVNPGSNFIVEPEETVDVVLQGLAYGASSEIFTLPEGSDPRLFVRSDDYDQIVLRLRNYEVRRATSQLIILAGEPDAIENTVRPVLVNLMTDTFPQFGGPKSVGQSLFVRYVLPFQMVAVLLLAAMVGAIVLAQRGVVKPKPGRPLRRKVSRPLTSVIASQTGQDVYVDHPQLEAPESEEQPEPAGD